MARNGNGTYSVPNSFVAGTTITASDHNENWTDLASELTNSLALDGQSTMTGQMKAFAGTGAAPGMTFGVDLDSGLYRIGSNNIGLTLGGTKYFDFSTTGLGITGDLDATIVKQGTYRLVPAGAVTAYAGATAPDGWLFCYGQAVSRTTYAALFAAIGTTFGSGDGSTTFNLPDLRGRVIAGKDDMGGSAASRLTAAYFGTSAAALGAAGGAESRTILQTHLPSVSFTNSGITVADDRAFRTASTVLAGGALGTIVAGSLTAASVGKVNIEVASGSISISAQGSAASGGSGTPISDVMPSLVLNFIIKI